MTVLRRAGSVLATVVVGLGATAMLAGAPAAAQSGRCAAGTGVTVVVDYGPLGGGTQIGCDPSGAGKQGSQVVEAAGFRLTYVQGEGFVCRIDDKPDEAHESCQHTPPEDAYWALFWSDGKSTTWKYSSIGVGGLKVPKGGSIGWRFEGSGTRQDPGAAPTQNPPKPSPSPSHTPKPSPTPRPTPKPRPSTHPHPQPTGPSVTPAGHTPPASSAPPAGGAASPTPPSGSGPAGAAPSPDGPGGPKGAGGDKGAGKGAGKGTGSGTGAGNGKPADDAGKSDVKQHGAHARRDQVEASADTTAAARSANGQKVLTAMAASSVVLLGAAVGVAGWRRRS